MIWNLILWLSTIWIAPFQCAVLNNETKFKKNIAVGVTFPYYGREDTDVVAMITQFKKRNLLVCVLLVLSALVIMFLAPITDESIGTGMTLWFLWVDLVIVFPVIPFLLCNRALKRIKAERGWRIERTASRTVDLQAVNYGTWTHPAVFFPGILLCVLPVLWDRTYLSVYLVMGISALICYLGYRFFYRTRAEVVDSDTARTKALTQVRHYYWSKTFLIAVYSMAVISLLYAFLIPTVPMLAGLVIIFVSILTVIPIAMAEFQLRHLQEDLTTESGKAWYADEDDVWPGGLFYYNPNDCKVLVKQRTGMNMTVNLARTGGKLYAAFVALLLLLMPFSYSVIDALVTSPITAEFTDDTLFWKSGLTSYQIAISDVASVELTDSLPEEMIRTAGTGAEHALRGNFSAKEIGHLYVCVDPTVSPFLLLKTNDGQTYLLGTRDAERTEELFRQVSVP